MQQITCLYYSSLNGLGGCCRMPNCITNGFCVTSLCIHDNILPIWSGVHRLPLHTSHRNYSKTTRITSHKQFEIRISHFWRCNRNTRTRMSRHYNAKTGQEMMSLIVCTHEDILMDKIMQCCLKTSHRWIVTIFKRISKNHNTDIS